MKSRLYKVLGLVMAIIMLAGVLPITAMAMQEFTFLNPLATIEPRVNTPLACRQGIIDILEGTGPRQLRIGLVSYHKNNNAEFPMALAEKLKDHLEEEHGPDLEVIIVTQAPGPCPTSPALGTRPGLDFLFRTIVDDDPNFIPNIAHPWNNRPDIVYDIWAERVDALIMGVAD